MDNNNPGRVRKLEVTSAQARQLEKEYVWAEMQMKRKWSRETIKRYRWVSVYLENARRAARVARWKIEHGQWWDLWGRWELVELRRRFLLLEEARAVKRAFLWAGDAVNLLGAEKRRVSSELEKIRGREGGGEQREAGG